MNTKKEFTDVYLVNVVDGPQQKLGMSLDTFFRMCYLFLVPVDW